MAEYTYPGVYVVEVATTPKPIPGVPTSSSAFLDREAIAAIGGLLDRLPPEWTDHNPHDPGIALLEFAAWLGESVLYRQGSPHGARLAAARLAMASLTVVADRRVPGSPIDFAQHYSGVIHDQGRAITDADGTTCLKIAGKRRDPLKAWKLEVSIDGVAVAGFSEISAPEHGIFEPLLRRLRKLLGLGKFANVTLKRGIVADRTLADWYRNILAGQSDRRDVVIRQKEPKTDYRLARAWITRIEGPALNGSANDIAIESIELACEAVCVHHHA